MRDIEYKPGSTDTLFASSSTTIYSSADGGSTWNDMGNDTIGLPNVDTFSRVELAVTPNDPNFLGVLYAKNVSGK